MICVCVCVIVNHESVNVALWTGLALFLSSEVRGNSNLNLVISSYLNHLYTCVTPFVVQVERSPVSFTKTLLFPS